MQAFSCTSINYRLVLKDTCNGSADITVIDDNGGRINIPYTMNCTNITIIAENELGFSHELQTHHLQVGQLGLCTVCPLYFRFKNGSTEIKF